MLKIFVKKASSSYVVWARYEAGAWNKKKILKAVRNYLDWEL